MNTLVVSRGILDRSVVELLRAIPLIERPAFALSVCARHLLGYGKACPPPPTDAAFEGMVKTGNFANESLRLIARRRPGVVVISQEAGQPGSLARLASDGVCLLNRGRTPVLLLPTVCSAPPGGRVIIAATCTGAPSVADGTRISELLDLTGSEVVVISIAPPFYPPFSRVSLGMRRYESKALHEVWDEQAGEATAQAGLIAAQLTACGRKPLFVGRTGRFAEEVSQASRSADTSLVCLLIDQRARKRLSKSVLLELFEKANAPVMLVPSAAR